MQTKYSKSKLLLTSVLSIVVLTCFFSCEKENEKENGTTWESSYFKGEFYGGYRWIGVECDKITISFKTGKKADITFQNCALSASDLNWGSLVDLYDNSANYTLKKNNITLKPKFTVPFAYITIPKQNWAGEIVGDRMTLKKVFGKTVELRKF